MKHIIILATLFIGLNARAAFMLEPFVNSVAGTNTATDLSSVDQSSTTPGISYGTKLGYLWANGVSVGGDYTMGSGKIKDSTTQHLADVDYTRTVIGAFVGYDYKMFRVWGGMGLVDELTQKAVAGNNVLKGTSTKIGIGIMPIHHLSINIEYAIPKYTKAAVAGQATDIDLSTVYSKFDTSVTSIGISAPFDFGGK